jgi:NADPH2:quinone reductase
VGKQIIYLCKEAGLPLINIVRREEQVKMLKEEYGCEYVLNSSSDNFYEEFSKLAKEHKINTLIECVSGPTTGKLLECMPSRSTILFYGALSEQPMSEIDPVLMIGRNNKIEGWILGHYL